MTAPVASTLQLVNRFARRRLAALLAIPTLMLFSACEPQATDPSVNVSPTPEPTPTATAVPVLDADYRVTTMVVADSNAGELDVDGDGKTDNGLSNALNELGSFLSSRIKAQLRELLDEGTITEEQYRALSASASAAIAAIFNVETINRSLEATLGATPWLESLDSTGPGTVSMAWWTGQEHSDGYQTVAQLASMNGAYTHSSYQVDARGPAFTVNLTLVTQGASTDVSLDLEDVRSVHSYVATLPLQDARLAGGISIAELETFVNDVLDKLGLLPFFDKDSIKELQADLQDLLEEVADIRLDSGEDAISVSLVYGATTTVLYGEAPAEE
ncbi:MAG: hypothetical protein ACKO6N_12340 [Myxococcota bacterium]